MIRRLVCRTGSHWFPTGSLKAGTNAHSSGSLPASIEAGTSVCACVPWSHKIRCGPGTSEPADQQRHEMTARTSDTRLASRKQVLMTAPPLATSIALGSSQRQVSPSSAENSSASPGGPGVSMLLPVFCWACLACCGGKAGAAPGIGSCPWAGYQPFTLAAILSATDKRRRHKAARFRTSKWARKGPVGELNHES